MARGILSKQKEDILKGIKEEYLSRDDAALCAGLSIFKFYDYLERSETLEDDILMAESQRNRSLLNKIIISDCKESEKQNAKWLLARLCPQLYAKPSVTERIKIPVTRRNKEYFLPRVRNRFDGRPVRKSVKNNSDEILSPLDEDEDYE